MAHNDNDVTRRLASYLAIDRSKDASLKSQVADGIARAAAARVLLVGARLPAAMHLAKELRIGTGTVVKAYSSLEKMGIIRAVHGLGSFVESDEEAQVFAFQRLRTKIAGAIREAQEVQLSETDLAEIVDEEVRRVYEVAS